MCAIRHADELVEPPTVPHGAGTIRQVIVGAFSSAAEAP